ncbi:MULTISPECIES: DUF3078 domain-containing protein [Bizionia]|uniref:DUF3078 domain-containing protein n=1 Tax=Bizionia algoritergicola TaxID=291187 RepID=A0A5D0QS63_9FLAO|nr:MULTISPECIES: DUF3078 domain-containing protein [Bizionia]OBX22039.1 hypothetical protein BAA08_10190 [Bizionia sp. APA-3]TYB71997.1 DUF3078 domain-containing protein [Bizionia algoritergicola]
MHKSVFVIFILLVQFVSAQPDSLYFKPATNPNLPVWSNTNTAGLDINEVAFVNWNSGGSNSISALIGLKSMLRYQYRNFIWDSNLLARYGLNKQEEQEFRKTDDLLEISSSLGFRKNKLTNWYYSARFSFKTQFAKGFSYPNTSNEISKFMAPGYLYLGGGVEYGKNIDKFSLYFSPLTLKTTFVFDTALSDAGSFGVKPAEYDSSGNLIRSGERVRKELGVLLTSAYETRLFENISIHNLMSFYTDYINDFGNVDIDWEIVLDFKVNNFVRATLGSHLKYDNDVKIQEEIVNLETDETEFVPVGARVQWKQLLGVGVVYEF